MRVGFHHPGKLQDGQVIASVLGMPQGLVKGLYILAFPFQLARLSLNLVQIMVSQVVLGLQVQADDPLYQGIGNLAVLVVYKPQQVAGVCLIFVKMKAFLQTLGCSGQIPDPGLLQARL